MKMPDCFEAYRILPLLTAVFVIAGCDNGDISGGGGASCTSSFSQPSGFEQEFDTFTIGEKTAENPAGATLDKTLFRQFFQAARPADSGSGSEEGKNLYRFMVSETDAFADLDEAFVDEPIAKDSNDEPIEYKSVRNGFDLLEAMIITSDDQFESLHSARKAMASCARDTQEAFAEGKDSKPGSISVNNISVIETPENEDEDPKDQWTFRVNYAHNPEPLEDPTSFGPNVSRVLFTQESFIFTLYDFEKFTGTGAASDFKQPGKLIAGFNAKPNETIGDEEPEDNNNEQCESEPPSVIFESFPVANTQDDRLEERGETDRWSWSAGLNKQCERVPETITTPEGTPVEAECIRTTIDYSDQNKITVELSTKTCPRINDTQSEFNANETFTYPLAETGVSQTRK